MGGFLAICRSCVVSGNLVYYLIYALIVVGASFTKDATTKHADKQPPMPGELGRAASLSPPIETRLLLLVLDLASFDFFRIVVGKVIRYIRIIFFMGDRPSFFRSFWRYTKFYYAVVLLPAAFLAPVQHAQRKPDFQLLACALLMIFINALGDVISVRLTLRNFEDLRFEDSTPISRSAKFWEGARNEASYYVRVLVGASLSLLVLIVVLALSSILYGVQIGELNLAFSESFFAGAWDRMLRFPELAFDTYWFRNQPGPFGMSGLPGLFLFGVVSFIPIIILFGLAVIWLMLMPFRIAVSLPTGPVTRLISSGIALVVLCITVSNILQIDVLRTYSFFIHN